MIYKTYSLTENKGVKLTAYLYKPLDTNATPDLRPAVLVFPGGGYSFCSEREAEPIALSYLNAGFHAFILDYSIGADAVFPRPLLDAFLAMRLIRSHSAEFGVIPDKIAVCGFSAGGHLAASLGTLWDREEFLKLADCSAEDVKPNALILGYPVISTSWMEQQNQLDRIIGNGDWEKTYSLLNTQNQVGLQTPPSFLFHTFRDGAVPVEDSLLFAAKLAQANVPFELHIYPNGGHGLSLATEITSCGAACNVDPDVAGWMPRSIAWLKRLFERPEEASAPVHKAPFSKKLPFIG